MLKKLLLILFSFIIGILAFWWTVSRIGFWKVERALINFPVTGLFFVFLVTFLIIVVNIYRMNFVIRAMGNNLSFRETIGIWFSGFAISFLTPISLLGGEFYQIYALRKIFKIPWAEGSASIFVNRVLDSLLFSIFLLFGIFVFFIYSPIFPAKKILMAGGGMTFILISLLVFFFLKSSKKESVVRWFIRFFGLKEEKFENSKGGKIVLESEDKVFSFFRERKDKVWKGIEISTIKYLLIFLRIMIIVYYFGGGWSIARSLSIYGFFNFCTLIPLPALLGSLELVEGAVFQGLGLSLEKGLAFSFLIRGVELIIVFIGLLFILKFSLEIIKIKIEEFFEKFNRKS